MTGYIQRKAEEDEDNQGLVDDLQRQLTDALARAERAEGENEQLHEAERFRLWFIQKVRACHPSIEIRAESDAYGLMNVVSSNARMYENYIATRKNDVAKLEDAVASLQAELAAAKEKATGATLQLNTLRPKLEDCEKALKEANRYANTYRKHFQEGVDRQEELMALGEQLNIAQEKLAAATAQATDFAEWIFEGESSGTEDRDGSEWREAYPDSPIAKETGDYLVKVGAFEAHPHIDNWYRRWLPKPAKGEGNE